MVYGVDDDDNSTDDRLGKLKERMGMLTVWKMNRGEKVGGRLSNTGRLFKARKTSASGSLYGEGLEVLSAENSSTLTPPSRRRDARLYARHGPLIDPHG